ncbi:MAG: HAD-IA family hydrolase [Acidimicrobiia bacterium]|nr:HAD-IA family hydrolase [Acidimicrobiia bacterium]
MFFDFGGVVLTSPFEAFERHERDNGLPVGFIRSVNTVNPDTNAWARMERGEVGIDGFITLFEQEAEALGHHVDGRSVIDMLAGKVRPEMVEAIRRIKATGLVTACLTNNFKNRDRSAHPEGSRTESEEDEVRGVLAMFDHMVESSVVGVRKPEPAFFRKAVEMAGVDPHRTVYLDDLGINLKPARAMGMTTIKVADPTAALTELQALLGIALVDGWVVGGSDASAR